MPANYYLATSRNVLLARTKNMLYDFAVLQ